MPETTQAPNGNQAATGSQGEDDGTRTVLKDLEGGKLTFEQAMSRLKELRGREGK